MEIVATQATWPVTVFNQNTEEELMMDEIIWIY